MPRARLTTHERFTRIFAHQEPDRIGVIDDPWPATLERWHAEGMPRNVSFVEYFDLDRIPLISVDTSPRFPYQVIEETEDHIIRTTSWGVTQKDWKHAASVPQFLDFTVKDPDSWRVAKERMTPSDDRIPWDYLKHGFPTWRDNGYWIQGLLWFGFDVLHSWVMGTEQTLIALVEQPEWCAEMFNHFLDVNLAMLDRVWDAGYTFDSVFWPDDLGYKRNQFFSMKVYRDVLKPVHKRAVDWALSKGIKAHLHSCGDVNPYVPEFIDIGVDALNPLEVKAGMDPVCLKRAYGDKLVLHGGMNAVLWEDIDRLESEMRATIPTLKEAGGYIWATDHSVPSCVSLKDFERIVSLAKELGGYD